MPQIIAQANFAAGAVLQRSQASACIHIGTPGRSVQRLAGIHSDSRRKHSDITAALCMKLMPKVH